MLAFRGAILAATLAVAAGPTIAPAGELARAVLEDGAYQKELPSRRPPEPDLSASREFTLPRFLLQAAVLLAAALALIWLVRHLVGRQDRDVALPADSGATPLHVELREPDRLAAAGRWDEAIHALLLETLAALSRAAQLAPSLTSREILDRVRLPARAREALEGLVLAVEITRFGGAPAGETDYRRCLDRFRAFLETYRRPAREVA